MPPESKYTDEIADVICSRLSGGESLRQMCEQEGMPCQAVVYKWLQERPAFVEKYTRARESQAEHFLEEIITIADDGSNDWMEREGYKVVDPEVVARSRLRVEARKWAMSKMAPKKYGDKLDLNNTLGVTDTLAALMEKIGQNGRRIHDKKPEGESDS